VTDWEDTAIEIASFRYRIIADAAEADGQGVTAAIERAAEREYIDPQGHKVKISARTLWRWLNAYQSDGLAALKPKRRKDAGSLRAFLPDVLEQAVHLRKSNTQRASKTIIDMLERLKVVKPGTVKRSTLDRHLDHLGASRRILHSLGAKTFKKILTTAPLELVIADFHHGPYVRLPGEDKARRALLLAFIDHFSRYVPEGRYYLHEDFAALRYGFRRILILCGPFVRLYIDNGPSFQTARFHAACKNKDIDIQVVHSEPYVSEGRGVCERFNRTVKEQFESEAKCRDDLLTLDELNAYFEAWLAERYHQDIHSETRQAPFERFHDNVIMREPPELNRIDELLRLRYPRTVHKKWCTVELQATRYLVDSSLRGRRVHALYDPFDPEYVLIEFDGRVLQRAYPQKPGHSPPQPEKPTRPLQTPDYLELLRQDYESRTQAELAALRLRPPKAKKELTHQELEALIATCRGTTDLCDVERRAIAACFRKMRPIDPRSARNALENARRCLGLGLHVDVYLDALQTSLVRTRTKGGKNQ
jgi:putative transposase